MSANSFIREITDIYKFDRIIFFCLLIHDFTPKNDLLHTQKIIFPELKHKHGELGDIK